MKITTKQDLTVVKAFQKHTYLTQSKPIIILLVAFFIMGVVCCLMGNYSTGGALIFALVVFSVLYPIALISANNKLNKSYKSIHENKKIEYEFLDNCYVVKSFMNGEEVESSKNEYAKIFKIDETDGYVFIYIANNMAHCLSKNDMDESKVEAIKDKAKLYNIKYKKTKR